MNGHSRAGPNVQDLVLEDSSTPNMGVVKKVTTKWCTKATVTSPRNPNLFEECVTYRTVQNQNGSQKSGNIVLKPVGAWDTKSAPCAVSSSFMKAQTAPSTASTAAGKSLRSGGHVTECPALPNGEPGPGQSAQCPVERVCLNVWSHVAVEINAPVRSLSYKRPAGQDPAMMSHAEETGPFSVRWRFWLVIARYQVTASSAANPAVSEVALLFLFCTKLLRRRRNFASVQPPNFWRHSQPL